MTYEEMKGYVDKCLEAYADSIRYLDMTGGECMLLGRDIDKIFSYAKSKGLRCSMVSNAFWASDYDKAYRTLKRLKGKGLALASFTTGANHNEYVPWTNVRNAVVASARLGIETQLRYELNPGRMEVVEKLFYDPDFLQLLNQKKLQLAKFTWMSFKNSGRTPRHRYVGHVEPKDESPCNCLFGSININPYGEVYACGGIGVCNIPQMRLGNINKEPISIIYERNFHDLLKLSLNVEGPEAMLAYVESKTGKRYNVRSHNQCDVCRTLFTNKEILPVIRDNFFEIAHRNVSLYNINANVRNKYNGKR